MRYFSIKKFSGVETKWSSDLQNRGTLRKAVGVITSPLGAISGGPQWKPVWNVDRFRDKVEAVLSGANATMAHFVRMRQGSWTFLICWDMALRRPQGVWYVAGEDCDLDADGDVTFTLVNSNKTSGHRWYASRIGTNIWFGNGVDANLKWNGSSLSTLGVSGVGYYDDARVAFPPCKNFVMDWRGVIYGGGNQSQKRRVWMTEVPDRERPALEGIYSLDISFVDIDNRDVSEITALGLDESGRIVAHTDGVPVILHGFDRTDSGYRCSQSSGMAIASAINPDCLRDTGGHGAYYLGQNLEIFNDHAVRRGVPEKLTGMDRDIVTHKSSGDWNSGIAKPFVGQDYHALYDRQEEMFFFFAKLEETGAPGWYAYNHRTHSVSGPFVYPTALVSTVTTSDRMHVVVADKYSLWWADFRAIREDAWSNDTPSLSADYDPVAVDPVEYAALVSDFNNAVEDIYETADLLTVGFEPDTYLIDSDEEAVVDSEGGNIQVDSPLFGHLAATLLERDGVTSLYSHAHKAVIETNYMDFGDPDGVKNFCEVQLNWKRGSVAYAEVIAESDGKESGKFRGIVYPRENQKCRINLRGQRIKLKIALILYNDKPALLRGITIGFLPGRPR